MTGGAGRRFNARIMEVANPIYDVVFKYLMQDQRAC